MKSYKMDEKAWIKAMFVRYVDWRLGQTSRPMEIEAKKKRRWIYSPIPKDRDQAFLQNMMA